MKKGFTLIELLIVIAIIGILATAGITNYTTSVKKAQDVIKKTAVQDVSKAIMIYYYANGIMPVNQTPGLAYCSDQANFLPELTTGGYIKAIPSGVRVCYYDYGTGNAVGGMVVAFLQGIPATTDTTTAMPETCRPYNNNWCSYTNASTDYCICNPY